jgi:prevent-host-death family protein
LNFYHQKAVVIPSGAVLGRPPALSRGRAKRGEERDLPRQDSRDWSKLHDPTRRDIDLAKDLVYHRRMEVNIHEAKTNLSKLLERVALGEEVVIAKAGKPVAKLVPLSTEPKTRILGSAKGEFVVPDDFNDPLPKEIEDLFYK